MKKLIALIVIGLLGISTIDKVSAQAGTAEVVEQMKKFSWMIGDWEGEAWYSGSDRQKTFIIQKEHIITRLEGTIITMEGSGYEKSSASAEAKPVFQAFGILTYDQTKSKFVLRAYRDGNLIDSEFTSNPDGSYNWQIEIPYGKTRYTIRVTPEGKWNEFGEFSTDGVAWNKVFEMTLSKLQK